MKRIKRDGFPYSLPLILTALLKL